MAVVGFFLQGLLPFRRTVAGCFWLAACSALWHRIRSSGERLCSSLCCKRA